MTAVFVAAPLRAWTGGRDVVEVPDGVSVGAVLAALFAECPGLRDRELTELGALRPHVNLFVGAERARDLAASVPDGVELAILPAVSGG
jgi:molybdopterin converting factor small subunit